MTPDEAAQKYAWTDEMDEISGLGGRYEIACRKMLWAGLAWSDTHPEKDLRFSEFEDVVGIINEENEAAKSLTEAIANAIPDCSGAMMQAAVNHVLFIRARGWDEFVKQMSARKVKTSTR